MVHTFVREESRDVFPQPSANAQSNWQSVYRKFLDSVSPKQQILVQRLLGSVHCGGSGLRDWVAAIAFRQAHLPSKIPDSVIDVYLTDSEAAPLHDCEACGFSVPVRPNRLHGMESEPEQRYFPSCPICGGRTGPYFFWSKQSDGKGADTVRRKKPR